jgi:exodeoxyribonuclease-5
VDADVFWPSDEQLRRQLTYVAVSRASQAVTLMAGAGSRSDQQQWLQWLSADDD